MSRITGQGNYNDNGPQDCFTF